MKEGPIDPPEGIPDGEQGERQLDDIWLEMVRQAEIEKQVEVKLERIPFSPC